MNLFEERKKQFEKAIHLEKTAFIPIEHIVTPELAVEYSGYPLFESLWDTDVMLEVMEKTVKAFDADIVRGGTFRSPRYYSALGAKSFVQSVEGFVQHPEVHAMEAEEYDAFIIDPLKFLINKGLPRLYSTLQAEGAYASAGLAKGINTFNRALGPYNSGVAKIFTENEMPCITAGATEAPFDFLADLLRSFSGISRDVRRAKTKVAEACEALLPLMIQKGAAAPKNDPSKMIFMPIHMPPFLNEKVFETLWWPTFKALVEALIDQGHYLYIFFEGDWSRFMDYLKELPPQRILGRFEYCDPQIAKDKLGKTMCLQGFYPLTLLARGTEQACIDKAKELIDILAPNGGFIFSFDKIATSAKDINPKNLHAVNNYIRSLKI